MIKPHRKTRIVAVDIEASGAVIGCDQYSSGNQGHLIAIGASAVDVDFDKGTVKKVGSFFAPMFQPYIYENKKTKERTPGVLILSEDGQTCTFYDFSGNAYDEVTFDNLNFNEVSERCTLFEKRCWDEFWKLHVDILDQFIPDGCGDYTALEDLPDERERTGEALEEYRKFLAHHDAEMRKKGGKMVIVSDNVSFDIGTLDSGFARLFADTMPHIYHQSKPHTYNGGIPCTTSMKKMLLMLKDPEWFYRKPEKGEDRNYWNRIRYLYGIPECIVEHDHKPDNDAYTIAYEYAHLHLIACKHFVRQEGKGQKRKK